MGAGPLPRVGPTDHPPRPPIPIVALDEEAMAAARARGESEAAVWLAGVAGARRPRHSRSANARAGDPSAAALTVAEVAAAVDAGRDLAAAAAADGIAVLVASTSGAEQAARSATAAASRTDDAARSLTAAASRTDEAARSVLAALATDPSRPLRALRRHGTTDIAVLCGVALGAGERGLGCACDGLAALAGAAVAAGIEPDLRPRLRALSDHELAARHSIAPVDAAQLEAALD